MHKIREIICQDFINVLRKGETFQFLLQTVANGITELSV